MVKIIAKPQYNNISLKLNIQSLFLDESIHTTNVPIEKVSQRNSENYKKIIQTDGKFFNKHLKWIHKTRRRKQLIYVKVSDTQLRGQTATKDYLYEKTVNYSKLSSTERNVNN